MGRFVLGRQMFLSFCKKIIRLMARVFALNSVSKYWYIQKCVCIVFYCGFIVVYCEMYLNWFISVILQIILVLSIISCVLCCFFSLSSSFSLSIKRVALLQFSWEIFRWMMDFICLCSKVFYQDFFCPWDSVDSNCEYKKKTLINLVAYSSCLR